MANLRYLLLPLGLVAAGLILVFSVFMFYFLPSANKKQIRPLVLTEQPEKAPQTVQENQPQQTPKRGEIGIKLQKEFVIYTLGVISFSTPEKLSTTLEKADDGYVFFAGKELLERIVIRFLNDDRSCWHRIKPGILENASGTIELYMDERSLESVCGKTWQYAPNVTIEGVVFPSELSDETDVRVNGEAPFHLTFKTTIRELKQKGSESNFWIRRSCENSFLATTNFVDVVSQIENSLPNSMPKKLPVLFTDIDKQISIFVNFVKPITDTKNTAEKFSSVRNSLYPMMQWFEKISEPEQMDLVSRYAPTAAKIAVKLIDKTLLERFLLGLDWNRDIVPADPRWYDDWYKIQPDREKRVAHFGNMSFRDLEFRLFWARRGETFFRIVKRAVSDEVVATATAKSK